MENFNFKNVKNSEQEYIQYFDYDLFVGGINIRNRLNGDYINFDIGKKKLKDFFIDKKITRDERSNIPLLVKGNEVIWIIGFRVNSKFLVNSKTKRVLICELKSIMED